MPKDKKEKKPKAEEAVEDIEMVDASPKVRYEVEWMKLSDRGGTDFETVHYRRKRKRRRGKMNQLLFSKILARLRSHWHKKS